MRQTDAQSHGSGQEQGPGEVRLALDPLSRVELQALAADKVPRKKMKASSESHASVNAREVAHATTAAPVS